MQQPWSGLGPAQVTFILFFLDGNLPSLNADVLMMWQIVVVSDLVGHLQVVGAVAFQNRRLPIPKDTNPELAALVESCWDE